MPKNGIGKVNRARCSVFECWVQDYLIGTVRCKCSRDRRWRHADALFVKAPTNQKIPSTDSDRNGEPRLRNPLALAATPYHPSSTDDRGTILVSTFTVRCRAIHRAGRDSPPMRRRSLKMDSGRRFGLRCSRPQPRKHSAVRLRMSHYWACRLLGRFHDLAVSSTLRSLPRQPTFQ